VERAVSADREMKSIRLAIRKASSRVEKLLLVEKAFERFAGLLGGLPPEAISAISELAKATHPPE
jgi:hypothetical protein